MIWMIILFFMRADLALAAELKGDFVRVNGIRFFAFAWQGNELFIPSDEFLSENERMSRSFCKSHLREDDIIMLRQGEMSIRDEELTKLMKLCKSEDAKIPEKRPDDSSPRLDHRNAESVKSILDYLIKK